MTGAVSAGTGVAMYLAAVLFYWKGHQHTPRIIALLVLGGTVGIIGTPVGGYLRQAVGYVDSLIAQFAGAYLGAAVTGLIAIAALYVFVHDMWTKTVAWDTYLSAVVLPISVATIPGFLGDLGSTAIGLLASGMGMAVGGLLGLS